MDILDKLAKSNFRSRFKLRAKELEYIKDKGLDTIYSHACDFIRDRVAPAEPVNDGKQTPMRGHPVFIAQHALSLIHIFSSNIFRNIMMIIKLVRTRLLNYQTSISNKKN